jgi:hypothetical protein
MKAKYLLLGSIEIITFLFFGCASSARDFTPHAPLALVSVEANHDINWLGEKTLENGYIVGKALRATFKVKIDNTKVNVSKADELVNEADSILKNILLESAVFRPEDKNNIINSEAYKSAASKRVSRDPLIITADGYKPLSYRNKNFVSALSRETGIQSALFITFTFNKEMVSGFGKNGKCRARVEMNTTLVNSQGKTIYHRTIESQSSGRIEVRDGFYSSEELMDLFRETIREACYRFVTVYAVQQADAPVEFLPQTAEPYPDENEQDGAEQSMPEQPDI